MSTIRVQYGLRINDLRDERGLSQRGFAALIGMSPTYLADIERGARNVSIDIRYSTLDLSYAKDVAGDTPAPL